VALRGKIKRMERIERLRRRMQEMSAWRLAAAAQEREKLAAAHAGMLEALAEGLMAFGPAAAAGTRRVRSIERELALAGAAEKDLEKRALDDGRLAKLADRSLTAAREAWRDDLERRSLQDLIDAMLAVAPASRKP
jgi:hypothetical protein